MPRDFIGCLEIEPTLIYSFRFFKFSQVLDIIYFNRTFHDELLILEI